MPGSRQSSRVASRRPGELLSQQHGSLDQPVLSVDYRKAPTLSESFPENQGSDKDDSLKVGALRYQDTFLKSTRRTRAAQGWHLQIAALRCADLSATTLQSGGGGLGHDRQPSVAFYGLFQVGFHETTGPEIAKGKRAHHQAKLEPGLQSAVEAGQTS